MIAAGIDPIKNKTEIEFVLKEEKEKILQKEQALQEELYEKYYKEMCSIIIDVDATLHNVRISLGCSMFRRDNIITARLDEDSIGTDVWCNEKVRKWYYRVQEIIKEIRANKQLSKHQQESLIEDLIDQD